MSEYSHIGKRKFWSGDVVTLCGITIPGANARNDWWFANCPKCTAAKKTGKKL